MVINDNDYIIVKNSANWASKSLSKMRLFFDKQFGSDIKDIYGKTENVNAELKEVYDRFVSGSIRSETAESKTANDHKAITSFIICGNVINDIAMNITHIIIPKLNKLDVKITKEDLFPQAEAKENPDKPEADKSKAGEKPATKDQIIETLESRIADLHNTMLLENVSEEDQENIIKNRNKVIRSFEEAIEIIKGSSSDDEMKKIYNIALDTYNSFLNEYKNKINNISEANMFCGLIKTASSMEEVASYYLLSLGAYGVITTPLKEKWLAIKKFLGFSGDNTVYAMRKDCIEYTKRLLTECGKFLDAIQEATKIKQIKEKWIKIITAYNTFALEYNIYRRFFIELYSILKIKANQDKLTKKQKKDKGKISEPALADFIDHSWVDMPARTDRRFPEAIIIK